jgi:hypothetical protein
MTSNNHKMKCHGDIWVISEGVNTVLDLSEICKGVGKWPVREHRISDLACYMLSPYQIAVEKKIIGCEIHYKQTVLNKLIKKIKLFLPKKINRVFKDRDIPPEVIISNSKTKIPRLKDRELEKHINYIYKLIRPYDLLIKKLSMLDPGKISDIKGICEEIGPNRLLLELKGCVEDKINYLKNNVLNNVPVILPRAYSFNGLFEMNGFNFLSYNPIKFCRLIIFQLNGEPKSCVIDSDNKVKYWINDLSLINYMHLLEQSIKIDPLFNESLNLCRKGNAKPLLIFFNKKLEMDYSIGKIPRVYKKVFEALNIGYKERNVIINSLNNLQLGISFKFMLRSATGEDKLLANLSVMHDLNALEPIKEHLPQLYSAINKRTPLSEAGKFYLLDSIRGYIDE